MDVLLFFFNLLDIIILLSSKGEYSMKLKEINELLSGEVLYGHNLLDREVKFACGADLMSDVLSFSASETLLLTGLTTGQVMRTAELINLIGVILVRGKKPSHEMLSIAEEKSIPLIKANLPMFEACGLIYMKGLRNKGDGKG